MKKSSSLYRLIIFILIVVSLSLIYKNDIKELFNQDNNTDNTDTYQLSNALKVHYIDVNQGDAIFIELPNKETMLIDAGEKEYGKTVENYVKKLGYDTIDYVVGTHPHTDHIGGLERIINNFHIKNVYMPKVSHNTVTYENLLKAIINKGLKVKNAKAGVNILKNDSLNINIISPTKDEYEEVNNYSAVIKVTYNEKVFLFMGDAETVVEQALINDVKADVLKVGHHGSNSSTSKAFLNRVNPTYAIIMVGEDNSYGHPKDTIIKRLENNNTTIYRTDINGTIIAITDGSIIKFEVEKWK